MTFDLDACLRHLVERGGSDLHLKVPAPPTIRLDGHMHVIDGVDALTPQDTARAGRDARRPERGILLLTGTTGSGKSTTLAAMVDHINATRARHIVTIEDPLEVLHPDKRSLVNQREVGMDTGSFTRALRRVLRQDPDVILIGEMRDEETVHTALSAAETGHLVFSTVHTADAAETVNRLIDFFPPHMHGPGPGDDRRDAQGRGLAAAGAQRRRQRAHRLLRGPAHDGPRARHDRRPRADGPAARGHRRGGVLRDAELRPAPLRAPEGRPRRDADGRPVRLQPRTTSSCWWPRTASAGRRWTTSTTRRRAARRWPRRRLTGLRCADKV
jgi:energy-coupling factor transporter ATP-binding protein EcfA2